MRWDSCKSWKEIVWLRGYRNSYEVRAIVVLKDNCVNEWSWLLKTCENYEVMIMSKDDRKNALRSIDDGAYLYTF